MDLNEKIKQSENKQSKKTILINGFFLCHRLSGIERYAYEITKRLDNISSANEIAMIVPKNIDIPEYKNLKIIRYGKKIKNILWQMIYLQWFLITHRNYTVLDYGNTALPFAPSIVFLHDIYCEFFPEDFKGFKNKLVRIYNRWQYRLIAKKAKKIVTVSEYSKNEITKALKADSSKIEVVYSSADHIKSIDPDMSIFKDYPLLKNTQYYFSFGNLYKRKNTNWIIDYAKNHPDSLFAISGTWLTDKKETASADRIPKNVVLLGYLKDEITKALMINCKAFILPSYYEGFGLTPLEALACGVPIIISNTASLPEIYGDTAHYIDPHSTNTDLDELLRQPVEKPFKILMKYSYDTAAVQVYGIIKDMQQ